MEREINYKKGSQYDSIAGCSQVRLIIGAVIVSPKLIDALWGPGTFRSPASFRTRN